MKLKVTFWLIGGIFGLIILIALAWPCFAHCRTTLMQAQFAGMFVAYKAYTQEFGTLPETTQNKDFIAALTGKNPKKIVFFDPAPKQLNEKGEILDNWGTPIRVTLHADEPPLFLSAGKDKIFGTRDDILDKR
jgi:hypothetical protein